MATILPNWEFLRELSQRVLGGEIACVPTDTVMGLIALPSLGQRLNEIKKSPLKKPRVLLIANVDQAKKLWGEIDPSVWKLAELWPGPLSIIVEGETSLALRMPDCAPLRSLLEITGPLASTSANLSGCQPAINLSDVPVEILDSVDCALDDPSNPALDIPSTILAYGDRGWRLVRAGALAASVWQDKIAIAP